MEDGFSHVNFADADKAAGANLVQALVFRTQARLNVFGAVIHVETLASARLGILGLRLGVCRP